MLVLSVILFEKNYLAKIQLPKPDHKSRYDKETIQPNRIILIVVAVLLDEHSDVGKLHNDVFVVPLVEAI